MWILKKAHSLDAKGFVDKNVRGKEERERFPSLEMVSPQCRVFLYHDLYGSFYAAIRTSMCIFFIHLIIYHLTKSLKKPEPKTRINITLPLIKTPLDPLTSLMTHYVLEMCIVEITSTFQIKKGRFQLMKLGCWTTLLYIKIWRMEISYVIRKLNQTERNRS